MKTPSKQQWNRFLKQLKAWYHPSNRKLPWKDIDDPYLVWVSEVFLQQTQADRVVEFFLRFTSRFPTVEKLAEASFEEALPYFRGLGFYGRLRRMLETAEAVVSRSRVESQESKGNEGIKEEKNERVKVVFPKEIDELESLPGIGPYTARAIASFAYKENVLAPDTNIVRILWRFFNEEDGQIPSDKKMKLRMDAARRKWVMKNLDWFDKHYPKDFSLNQVLMDFGAQVCQARKPKCGSCPLRVKCRGLRVEGREMINKGKNKRIKELKSLSSHSDPDLSGERISETHLKKHRSLRSYQKVVVGVLIQGKRVLVSRRKPDQTYAGLLEFPGGKVEQGEDLRRAMQREFREEVGVEVSVRPAFEKIVLDKQKRVLHFHRCRVLSLVEGRGSMVEGVAKFLTLDSGLLTKGLENQELFWIDQEDLDYKAFIPVNKGVIEMLKKSRF